jgi:DNA-binding transcriptional LysR family regulator
MEISQLQYFVTISETGNYGRAAEALNVTQSALSKSIKRLEAFLGSPLFERTAQGVRLTVFGKGLIHYAKVIISERNRAIAMIAAIRGHATGNLKVGVSKHLTDFLLPDAVMRLLEKHPGFWVEVVEGYLDELSEQLLSGSLDLVFAGYRDQTHAPALVYEKLLDSDSVIVARPGHPLAGKKAVSRAELMKTRWILPVDNDSIFQFYNSMQLEGSPYDPRALPIFTTSEKFGLAMVKRGNFIIVSPRHAVSGDLASGALVEVKGPMRKRMPNVGIITRRHGYRSPALVSLVREIRKRANEVG